MFPNISQAPALLTPLHRVVRQREAQGAVTLNDFMNKPGPFRAHCVAVSCFDMGPNTSLALGQRVWVQSPFHEEGTLQRLAACSLQRLVWCFSAWLRGTECGMWLTQGLMDVSHCCSSLSLTICLSACFTVWMIAVNNVRNKCCI